MLAISTTQSGFQTERRLVSHLETRMEKRMMSTKAQATTAKVDVKALNDRAAAVGVKIDQLIKAGLTDTALELVESKEALKKAETELAATSKISNRYSFFHSTIVKALERGELPSKVEDKDIALSILQLIPKRGDDIRSRWAAKGLWSCYWFLAPEVKKAVDTLRTNGFQGKGLAALPADIKDPVLALIPEKVKKAVGLI